MLARTALARLRARVPSVAARDAAHLSRQLRTTIARAGSTNNVAAFAHFQRIRGYATATKTTKKTTKATASTKKPATKKTAAKETATKKTATKKPVAKKAATPQKPAATKKRGPKKLSIMGRPRMDLTEREKEILEKRRLRTTEKKKKDEISELKAIALQEPKGKPSTAFQVLVTEIMQNEVTGSKLAGPEIRERFTRITKEASEKYKNLSPAETERLNRIANEAAEENRKALQKWIHSYTPLEIKKANNARRLLKDKIPGYNKAPIQDDRAVARPTSAFVRFYQDRINSGDYKNIAIAEAGKLAGQEWKALSASEKQKYQDAFESDRQRYAREYKNIYGEDAPFLSVKKPAKTTA
ncbi:High mobility group HMG1/HMG2 [Macrophomina phaseolina MS6]|uniref:High mobility group HMG1/HMG2 n=2 Tax=Macrophomina phaseolina TaxID=35725 RepID=K2SRM5_MACPH|nr:High mobility group HMG1/HMG2 [Macrophomina phaseolina MS6]KAH7028348.1 hypothetical protein B0J12DRAFT_351936 [Macrophomina phaseolina]